MLFRMGEEDVIGDYCSDSLDFVFVVYLYFVFGSRFYVLSFSFFVSEGDSYCLVFV